MPIAGALALLLAGPAPPSVAAAGGELPDLGSVVLTPEDLPPGFAVSDDAAEDFFQAAGALAELFDASPDLADRNGVVLERRGADEAEFVVMTLAAPLSPEDQATFDREMRRSDIDGLLSGLFGTAEASVIGDLGVGEERIGIRMEAEGGAVTEEMVIFRRGPVIAYVGHAWVQGTTPTISLGDVARTLDGRLAAVTGAAPAAFRDPGPLVPGITTHIPTPLDVSTDPAVVGTNLLLAAFAMLLLTISSKLATRLLAEHEEAVARRVPLVGLVGRFEAGLGRSVGSRVRSRRLADLLGLAGVALFYGLVFAILDPTWEPLSATGLWLLASMTVACGVVGIADDLVQWRVARGWQLVARLGVRPTNALLAVLSTGVSRLGTVVPGLMFGTPEALQVDESALDEPRARRLTLIGFVALVAIGGTAWAATIATTAIARSGATAPILGGLEALLLLVFAATVQNLFVSMLGLTGSAGDLVRRWSPIGWGIALLGITFLFWHTLLNPLGDASAALSSRNVQVTLGLVVGFTVVTVGAWIVLRLAAPRSAGPAAAWPAPTLAPAPSWPAPAGGTPWPAVAVTPAAVDIMLGTADGKARGPAWFRFAGGSVTVRTELIDPKAASQYRAFVLLSALATFAPFIAYAARLGDREAAPEVAIGLLALLVAWVIAAIVGRLVLERYRVAHTVTFPAAAVAGVDVGRDWALGCLLALLLTPLLALLYLVFTRGRAIRVRAPFAADRAGLIALRFKGSDAEGRHLQQLVLASRSGG